MCAEEMDVTGGIRVVRDVVAGHRLMLGLGVAYVAIGSLVLAATGQPWSVTIVSSSAGIWAAGTIAWLTLEYLRHPRRLRAALEPRRIGGAAAVFLLVTPFQTTFNELKRSIEPVMGFTWDPLLSEWDIALHGQAPWRWLEPLLDNAIATRAIDLAYAAWFPLFLWLIVWMSWSSRRALRMRAILSFLVIWILFGTLGAWATSSAGPCYYAEVVGSPNAYDELVARLDSHGDLVARASQRWLWDLQHSDGPVGFAGVSAMPSMHVAMAVLFALIGWQLGKVPGIILACYALIVQVGSVLMGWHYAIDGYAGALGAVLAWRIAVPMMRWCPVPPPTETGPPD
jgi:hypothetical protein